MISSHLCSTLHIFPSSRNRFCESYNYRPRCNPHCYSTHRSRSNSWHLPGTYTQCHLHHVSQHSGSSCFQHKPVYCSWLQCIQTHNGMCMNSHHPHSFLHFDKDHRYSRRCLFHTDRQCNRLHRSMKVGRIGRRRFLRCDSSPGDTLFQCGSNLPNSPRDSHMWG